MQGDAPYNQRIIQFFSVDRFYENYVYHSILNCDTNQDDVIANLLNSVTNDANEALQHPSNNGWGNTNTNNLFYHLERAIARLPNRESRGFFSRAATGKSLKTMLQEAKERLLAIKTAKAFCDTFIVPNIAAANNANIRIQAQNRKKSARSVYNFDR